MELSESVQKGLQSLADPSLFDLKTSSVLISATTCILEGVKQNVDKSTISSYQQTCAWRMLGLMRREHITYQYREMPSSYQRRVMAPGVIKNGHVHKVNEPSYLISLNVENINNGGSSEEVHFCCTMEQLQIANVLLQPI
ncbi:COMM domain-containing protein 3 [Oncorhynchus keta]|uniref:COMM domain-containing protein 3 n=1 Tax=Oncorhynchus keta TaxID=8018 RepID=UPI00227C3C51|nr:COMM domain-containing protein 3 [Oncorhynchus keta]